jgi:hypothetical protein
MTSGIPVPRAFQNCRDAVLRAQNPRIHSPGEILTPQSDASPNLEKLLLEYQARAQYIDPQ